MKSTAIAWTMHSTSLLGAFVNGENHRPAFSTTSGRAEQQDRN
jgi:hypothetical protein